jgi:hypothetical protein
VTTRRRATTAAAAVAVLAISIGSLASCGQKAQEPFQDAERGQTNDSPADTITFPDGFSNVASKCDGPNRVYVLFKSDAAYGSVSVVPNDPRCSDEVQ